MTVLALCLTLLVDLSAAAVFGIQPEWRTGEETVELMAIVGPPAVVLTLVYMFALVSAKWSCWLWVATAVAFVALLAEVSTFMAAWGDPERRDNVGAL